MPGCVDILVSVCAIRIPDMAFSIQKKKLGKRTSSPNKTKEGKVTRNEQEGEQVQIKAWDRIFQTNSIKASNKITINFAMTGVGKKAHSTEKGR